MTTAFFSLGLIVGLYQTDVQMSVKEIFLSCKKCLKHKYENEIR